MVQPTDHAKTKEVDTDERSSPRLGRRWDARGGRWPPSTAVALVAGVAVTSADDRTRP